MLHYPNVQNELYKSNSRIIQDLKQFLFEMDLYSEEEEVKTYTKLILNKTILNPQININNNIRKNIFKKKKEEIDPKTSNIILRDFLENNQFQNVLFTDGSKKEKSVSFAVTNMDSLMKSGLLHYKSSIFSAESRAIKEAVQLVSPDEISAIVTDSMSTIEEIASNSLKKSENCSFIHKKLSI